MFCVLLLHFGKINQNKYENNQRFSLPLRSARPQRHNRFRFCLLSGFYLRFTLNPYEAMRTYQFPFRVMKAISAYEREVIAILVQALDLTVSDAQLLVESYHEVIDNCYWQSLSPSTACIYINDLSTVNTLHS